MLSSHPQDRLTLRSGGVLAGIFIGNAVSANPVISGTFGVFLGPLSRDLNWPRSAVSGLLLALAVIGDVGYPLFGRLADRRGDRRLLIGGNIIFGGAVAALSLSKGAAVWTYALFCLAGVAGCAPSAVVAA